MTTAIEIKIVAPELAQALNALAAAIAGGTPRLPAETIQTAAQVAEKAAEPEKPKATARGKKAETAPSAETVSEEATSPGSEETASTPTGEDKAPQQAATEAEPLAYSDVQRRVLDLAKHSRDDVVELLGQFGVDHGKKLTEEQWPEFIELADAKIAEYANA
ncbi:MAG TPA: hypothetical protein PL098_00070 [Brevundimonas diminuta]|nr:hypothetical protein [Brevundimonas diminuta]HRL23299.1 hypothetical protein [Brevundimonas diminuta]